jgi:hypothetical protein
MRRRRRNPDMRATDWLVIGGVAAGAYFLYKLINKAPDIAKKATAPVAQAIANAWTALTLGPPMQGVLGNVVLPDGTNIGPLARLQVKNDADGNVYVMSGGTLYQLGQSDINGDWPAQLVLDTNFGTTGAGW